MSVLIKGWEIPKNCKECDFYNGYDCLEFSNGVVERYNYNADIRPEWCGFIEVPTPHGRLIDADAFIAQYQNEYGINPRDLEFDIYLSECVEDIIQAPTVIESED